MIQRSMLLVGALARLIRDPHRDAKLTYTLDHVRWLEANQLPVEFLVRLLPEAALQPVTLSASVEHPFELPYGERLVLAALASWIRPELIVEFGTFRGSTTRLLADSAPGATVHTIDLPDDRFTWDPWIARLVGSEFRDDPSYGARIVQHRCDSREFSYDELRRKVGLVFVDASHDHDDVLHDSEIALEIVAEDGVIVWDDYQPAIPGVASALRVLRRRGLELAQVAETRLVLHRPRGFANSAPERAGRSWSRVPDREGPEDTGAA